LYLYYNVQENKLKFIVNDMTCAHCVGTIEKTLKKTKGVKSVKIDLNTKIVEVNGTISNSEIIIETLKETGYEAKEI